LGAVGAAGVAQSSAASVVHRKRNALGVLGGVKLGC
jgi:hypothetical protein